MANSKTQTKPQAIDHPNESQEAKLTPKDVDINQYITVKSGFQGKLVYKSPRTGEKFVWENLGAEQELELKELRSAKASSDGKKFFVNNWFMFDDEWVLDFLGVRQYYKNAIRLEDFDDFLLQPAATLKKSIQNLSPGQRKSIAYRAMQMITDGEIDSRKTISVLEEALGIELVEK